MFHVFYTHVAPLGLGDMAIRHCYIHVGPLGLWVGQDACPTGIVFSLICHIAEVFNAGRQLAIGQIEFVLNVYGHRLMCPH